MFSCCCDPKKDKNNVNIFTNSKILTTANNNINSRKNSTLNFLQLFKIKPKNKSSKIYNNKNLLKFQENNKSIIEEKSENEKSYLTYKNINNIFNNNNLILNKSDSQFDHQNQTTNLVENIKFSYYDENEEENLEFHNKNKLTVKFDKNIFDNSNKKKNSLFNRKSQDKMKATEIINLMNNLQNKKKINSFIEHSSLHQSIIKENKSLSTSKSFSSKNSSNSSSSGYENIDNDNKKISKKKKKKKKKKVVTINEEKNLITKRKKSINFDNSQKSNLLQRRRSSVLNLNYGNYSNQKINTGSRKNSILSIYDKSLNVNEYRLFSLVSLNNHFLSRDDLIKKTNSKNEKFKLDNLNELSNIEKFNFNNSNIINSKIKFLYLSNYAGNLLIENLTISPIGLCYNKSERNMKDTLTFFGYSAYKNVNDYVLNNTTFIYNNRTFTKTLFAISYDINCSKYFIQPIIEKNKQGRFIYFKITSTPYYFINSKLILINKTLIQFITSSNLNNNKKIFHLIVKIYEKDIERSSNFTFNNFKDNQQILIGYESNADIRLKNEGFIINSFYCKIFIDTERELWGLIGKGIWMVLDQKTSINKYLLIKIGDEIIKISLNN